MSNGELSISRDACGFTIESLWDDFDRRTSHYRSLKPSLERTDPRLLHWIGSVDYSGYTREICLSYLLANYVEGDENRILLRLADWVPEVQRLAAGWILASAETVSLDAYARSHRLILHLKRKERLAGHPAIAHLEEVLASKARSIPREEFLRFPVAFRRLLYDQSLDRDEALRGHLLADPDPHQRLLLLGRSPPLELTQAERCALARDRAVLVRRAYLRWRIARGDVPDREELVGLAFDRSFPVRELAGFHLRQLYGLDARELYRQRDDEAAYYVADRPAEEDIPRLIEGIRERSGRIRQLCLGALARLDPMKLRELDLGRLVAESAKARRLIARELPSLLTPGEIRDLRSAFESAGPKGILDFLRLLARGSYWDFVDIALEEMVREQDEALVRFVTSVALNRIRLYTHPGGTLRDRIARSLEVLAAREHPDLSRLIREIEFSLRTAGGR